MIFLELSNSDFGTSRLITTKVPTNLCHKNGQRFAENFGLVETEIHVALDLSDPFEYTPR